MSARIIRKILQGIVVPVATTVLVAAGVVRADLPIESAGRVERLPAEPGPHWVWVSDIIQGRAALFDADDGRMLGMLSAGTGVISAAFPSDHRKIYLPETYYARRTRGERTDVVTVYDASTLAPMDEIVIPPKRGEHATGAACSALSDDDRFLAVFNLTPATSLSIVDVREQRFAGEISTPGCGLVYAAGNRRFAMLCGNGELLTVTVDDGGRGVTRKRTGPFFDPMKDPVTEKAVRHGDQWLFVSFEGFVHAVDFSSAAPRFPERWSLLSDADRRAGWRIGGAQHLALHERTGRLYSLMHRGEVDTHKEPGTEVWVYDLGSQERIQRIEVRSPIAAFVRQMLELEEGGFFGWLVERVVPNSGVDRILVTQDEAPVLLMASAFPATLAVHDALTGVFLRDLEEVGIALGPLQTP